MGTYPSKTKTKIKIITIIVVVVIVTVIAVVAVIAVVHYRLYLSYKIDLFRKLEILVGFLGFYLIIPKYIINIFQLIST